MRKSKSILIFSITLIIIIVWLTLNKIQDKDSELAQKNDATKNLDKKSSELLAKKDSQKNISSVDSNIYKKESANLKLQQRLSDVHSQLSGLKDPDQRRELLKQLEKELWHNQPSESAKVVRQFLETKKDAPAGGGFQLRENGTLEDATTLRVFLLDQLGRLNLEEAGKYAETIFENSNSSDEWALAFRNYAWSHTPEEGSSYLRNQFNQLLNNRQWRAKPSAGFLESFDVLVHTNSQDFIPQLGKLLEKKEENNQAVAHASFLTIDRLVIDNPEKGLSTLLNNWQLLQDREKTRAGYFARADFREPSQREIIEKYILRDDISKEELTHFFGLFPNQNYFTSNNLLTKDNMATGEEIAQRDSVTYAVIQQWIMMPQFADVQDDLFKLKERLEYFLKLKK